MIKDTNPDHYKVGGANFIKYMDDPKISGFGNWMFANGFNSGVWASTNWISVKDRLPEVDKSILYCAFGSSVGEGVYRGFDGRHHVWNMYAVSGTHWDNEVTHWMPLPEPPKTEK